MGSNKFDKAKQCQYEKPRLRVIELKAEEVMAVGCKMMQAGLAVGGPTCLRGTVCFKNGS